MKFILVAEFAGATASGVGVGLAERSAGWGIVGFTAFGLVALLVGTGILAVAGGRKALKLVYDTHHGRPTGQCGGAGQGSSS